MEIKMDWLNDKIDKYKDEESEEAKKKAETKAKELAVFKEKAQKNNEKMDIAIDYFKEVAKILTEKGGFKVKMDSASTSADGGILFCHNVYIEIITQKNQRVSIFSQSNLRLTSQITFRTVIKKVPEPIDKELKVKVEEVTKEKIEMRVKSFIDLVLEE